MDDKLIATIMEIPGVESCTYHYSDIEQHHDECFYIDDEADPEQEHFCSGCMDCLGLSWKDFLF